MTPYANETLVTTTGANQVVAVPCPSRCTIDRIAVVRVGTGAIAADFYNRAFAGTARGLASITDDGHGKCLLTFASAFPGRVGDSVTVAGCATSGYNVSHRITAVVDPVTVVTDQSFTVRGVPAANALTGTPTVPTEEQILYKVTAQLSGNDGVETTPAVVYVNRDPPDGTGRPARLLYVKLATAATYRIALRSHESIGEGG